MPTVDINGTQVEYDPEVADSWDVAELIVKMEDGSPFSSYEKLMAMFEVVRLCCGLDRDAFVQLCGGGRVNRETMAQHLGATINQLVSKN